MKTEYYEGNYHPEPKETKLRWVIRCILAPVFIAIVTFWLASLISSEEIRVIAYTLVFLLNITIDYMLITKKL